MDRSEASQRIRVAAAAYSPRLESSPSSQSMDSARNARNATRRSSGIWPGLLLSVRFAAHACKCIRVYRGSLRSPYHLLLLPLLAPPFELRRSSNRHAATVARENVLVSRYRIYHPLHFPPPVYILPRKGHEIPGLFLYGRIANQRERELRSICVYLCVCLSSILSSLCFVLFYTQSRGHVRARDLNFVLNV